jgi:hypothetical protein
MESMRKDVESTFGMLKGRWRILKMGIRVHGAANGDTVLRLAAVPCTFGCLKWMVLMMNGSRVNPVYDRAGLGQFEEEDKAIH